MSDIRHDAEPYIPGRSLPPYARDALRRGRGGISSLWAMLRGAVAGLGATAVMTGTMAATYRWLAPPERYPLQPREITEKVTDVLGMRRRMSEEQHVGTTLLLHAGYGAAMGAVYPLLADRIPGPSAVKGIAYGLLVYAGSYLGWLPALGVLRPATEFSAQRNALMIFAHVVWGAVLGQSSARLRPAAA
jgi:uncharacterized membrane protein YagU involved in acid resistance